MAFDVQSARKDGYSDTEIANFLASQNKFDTAKARSDGYSDSEIVDFLTSAGPAKPSVSERAVAAVKGIAGISSPTKSVADLAVEQGAGADSRVAPQTNLSPMSEAGYNSVANIVRQKGLTHIGSRLDAGVDRAIGINQPVLGGDAAINPASAGVMGRAAVTAINDTNTQDGKQVFDEAVQEIKRERYSPAFEQRMEDKRIAKIVEERQGGEATGSGQAGPIAIMSELYNMEKDAITAHLPAAFADAIGATGEYAESLRKESEALTNKRAKQFGGNEDVVKGLWKRSDLRDASHSMAFSVVSMGLGAAAGLSTTALTGSPAAGWLAMGAASGGSAFNMDAAMVTRQLRQALNDEYQAKHKRDATEQEWNAKYDQFKDAITRHGLHEAGWEAAGNIGLGKIVTSASSIFGKNAVARFGTKILGSNAVEAGTESATQIGQHNAEIEMGLQGKDAAERSFLSAGDWATSLKEVLPQTLLISTVMGGTGAGAHHIYRKVYADKRDAQDLFEAAADGKLDGLTSSQIAPLADLASQIKSRSSDAHEISNTNDYLHSLYQEKRAAEGKGDAFASDAVDVHAADVLGTPEPAVPHPNAAPGSLASAANIAAKSGLSPQQNMSILQDQPATSSMAQTVGAAAASPADKSAPPNSSNDAAPSSHVGIAGKESEVVLPDNSSLPAMWEVVDADQIAATMKEGKNQPRDRSRAASNVQVQGIANNPDYRRLSDSPVMDVGAPTITHDGVIVGGNGRFEGVSRAYDQGTAGDYLARLKADAVTKGIDPDSIDGIKKPVLVRRVTQPFDVRSLAVASNSGGALKYSALELAKIDGDRMGGIGDIEVSDNGDVVLTGDNMGNVRKAFTGYTTAELGDLVDKDGLLSQEGIRRVKNAMLYKAYGNSPTLERLIETADNDLKSVSGALVRAAGSVAKVRSDMERGAVQAELDISSDIVAAVEQLSKIKSSGSSLEQYLAQQSMFGREISEDATSIMQFFAKNIRSQKAMAEVITSYYDGIASEDRLTGSMFGDAYQPTTHERLNNALGKQTEQTATESAAATTASERPDNDSRSQDRQQPAHEEGSVASSTEGQQVTENDGSRAAPITVEHHDHVKLAEQNVNTSPSDAQKEAGNYSKGHIQWNGLDIAIENPLGSTRSGMDSSGKAWEVSMPATYGYIKRTEGADGDHLDVYIGKAINSDKVFVIDQLDHRTGVFDEHKVMLGFPSMREAERNYKLGFSDKKGGDRLGAITEMSVEEFKQWAKTEDTTKPIGDIGRAKAQADMDAALAEAGALMRGAAGVKNIVPEDKAKWMPVITKLFGAAFRLGYYEMKDASAFVREQLSKLNAQFSKFVSKDWMDEAAKQALEKMPQGFADNQGLFGASAEKTTVKESLTPQPETSTVQPESGKQDGRSDNFKAYEQFIKSKPGALSDGLINEIKMDERLEDGEAEILLAMGSVKQPESMQSANSIQKADADHVQDRMTNADKKRNPDNFKVPPLHTVVSREIEQKAHDLIAKHKTAERKVTLDPADVKIAEEAIAPILAKAEKNLPAFKEAIIDIAHASGIGQMVAGIKRMDRCVEKMLDTRDPDDMKRYTDRDLLGRVTDVYASQNLQDTLRATIVVKSYDDVDAVIAEIGKHFEIVRRKDRVATPMATGYRDNLLNVRMRDGMLAEIQINTPEMLSAKDLGHKAYKIERSMSGNTRVVEEAQVIQRELYDAANSTSLATSAKNSSLVDSHSPGNLNPSRAVSNSPVQTMKPLIGENILPSGSTKNSPDSLKKNRVPSGNLSGNSETGNLSGNLISGSSKHIVAKNASGVHNNGGDSTKNTTGANDESGSTGARGHAGEVASAGGAAKGGRNSGTVRQILRGRNEISNRLPSLFDSREAGVQQPGQNASGADGNNELSATGGTRNNPRRDAGVPAGRPAGRDIPAKSGLNYHLTDGDLDYKGSWIIKAKQNIAAVELVKKLESEKRSATREEQAILARFIGWGASEIRNKIFDPQIERSRRVVEIFNEAQDWFKTHPSMNRMDRSSPYWNTSSALQNKGVSIPYGTDIKPEHVAKLVDSDQVQWLELHDKLKELLAADEWKTAERSTQYAHYTGKEVVNEMWRAVDRMGFKGGALLEPGAGIGVFPGLMPEAMANNSIYTGIEYDALTGAILKHLQPDERILVESFIDSSLPDNFYDVAIGNPPFSDAKVLSDPRYKKHGFALHDYFFAKTLDKVKPGGLVMFVTSRHTMDKQGDKARKHLSDRADLLGAIRLPQTAFQKNAGTEVVTDILFLRKKVDGEVFEGHSWMGVESIAVKGGAHLINEYFAKHPEMVLGEGAMESGQFGKQYTVLANKSVPITELLAKAVDRLPRDVYHADAGSAAQAAQVREIDWNPKAKKEGNYYVADDGALMQVENRAGVPAKVPAKDIHLLKSFVALRDALNLAQYDQLNNGDWEASLKALQKQYKAFVKAHGNILQNTVTERIVKTEDEDTGETIEDTLQTRRFTLQSKISDDPEYTKVMALETINDDTGKVSESKFLSERLLEKRKEATISTPHDALLSSLNDIGKVDIPLIAQRIGMSERDVIESLGSSIYESPSIGWQMSDEYLSGNVKGKLKEAQESAKSDKRFERNVEALMQAQPAPVPPSDITASIGMNWIPSEVYEQFLLDKTGVDAKISYNEHTGNWNITALRGYGSTQATSDWGTPQRPANEIMEAALTGRPIRITKTEGSGKDKKSVFDAPATELANQKLKEMREAFKQWIWQDTARTDKLVSLYNNTFNTTVSRKFDGRHLTLPGSTSTISVFDHVKRGAWRIIQSGNSYLAHAVGSGKTWQMVISAMEQKRLGLINKPMVVVPNHMLQQFAQEWMQLYPASRLMVADEKQFHTDNRKRFVAHAAMSDLDGIIITHSAFKLLDLDPEFKQKMMQEQLDYMEAALTEIMAEDGIDDAKKSRNPKVRDIQNRIEKLEEKLKSAMSGEGKDKAVRFDEMGVDFLYVDEAHEFRKLPFTTARQVKGIDSSGSERAFDLYMKSRWLEEKHPGRSLVMASGTPVTNTLAEIYSVQRFMQPDVLEERGLQDFDAWASMFGEEHTEIEADASGKYSPVTRFSKFINVPELTQMFREFADVLTSDHLAEMLGDKRPKLKNGARKIVVTPETSDYKLYREELAARLKKSRDWKPSKDQPNNPDPIIKIIGDGRLAAIDMRFIWPDQPSDPNSKLNQMIDGVIRSYKKYGHFEYVGKDGKVDPVKGATQMVFSDIGFGAGVAAHRGFNARGWMEKRLRDAGIPSGEIAFMADYKKSAAKVKLFKDVNAGRVRILIGSSKNMGTGVNAQQRLRALHHLDTPWYPADLEQREGRIVRQGNKNRHVRVYAYSTKGSYDTVMWQLLARKQKFIDQALSGDSSVRELDDISESSQFAMATAMTAGDERAIQLAGLKADIEKYQRLFRAHEENRMRMREAYELAGNTIKVSERKLPDAEKLAASVKDLSGDKFIAKAGKKTYSERKEWGDELLDKLKSYTDSSKEGKEQVGELSGFPINIIGNIDRNNDGKVLGYYARLEMRVGEDAVILARDPADSPIGMAMRATNALTAISRKPDEFRQAISDAKSKRNAMESRIDAPFQFTEELSSKIKEADALETEMLADSNKPEVSEIEQKARAFAEKHHGEIDQRRKFTNEPYITHPAGVVEVLKTAEGVTPEMIAAAWVHDTVEDTKATIEDVRRELGDKVADLVAQLTKPAVAGSVEAQTIKLADIVHNVEDAGHATEQFKTRYLKSKLEQLDKLSGGDAKLMERARNSINAHLNGDAPLASRAKNNAGQTVESISEATARLRAAWTGFKRIKIVQHDSDLPQEFKSRVLKSGSELSGSEGWYDPATKTVYLVADNISSPERAVWVAAHEVAGHGGIRMLGTPVIESLNHAAKNRFVTKLAKAIAEDRGETFDAKAHTDEAIAELAAATITGNVDAILERYGVKVPTGMRSNLLGMVKRVVDAVRKFLANALGKPIESVSDGEVLGMIRKMKNSVEGVEQGYDTAGVSQGAHASVAPKQKTAADLLRAPNKNGIERDTGLIDKAFQAPFLLLHWNNIVSKNADRILSAIGDLIPETVKAGVVDNYGIDSEYIDSKADMQAREAAQNRKAHGMVEMLAGLTRAESRVAYYWMQEQPGSAVEQQLMEQLPEKSRETLEKLKKLISDMGKDAVRLGQMSQESYERNNMAYLHRTYAKHVLAEDGWLGNYLRARAIKIKGNQYKGRGIFDEIPASMIGGEQGFGVKMIQGKADNNFVGQKVIRLELRDADGEGMDALPGMVGKPQGKLREVVYWPEGKAIPSKYADWISAGSFEVRNTKGDKLVVWRDLTREERERLGELDEVRYAVAQTLQMMIHDVEVGRFLEWTASKYGKAKPEGKEVAASESMLKAFHQDEWVQVPTANIPGTQTKKYGALAGVYVPGSIWNDIRQTAGARIQPFGKTYANVLGFWKKSKTVWSPGVHMNNVMANFVMADWNDVRAVDMADALRVWALNDKDGYKELFQRFEDSGALGGMFQSNEVMRDEIKQRLAELKDDLTGQQEAAKEMGTMAKVLQLVSLVSVKPAKAYTETAAKLYQGEDAFFRLAVFLKAVRHGKTDIEAGRMARHAFLNYDINAPWVQMARQTVLPFVSFFYRAAPMLYNTAKNKPWKIAKLVAFAYMVNALGYAIAGGGDDEDKDRKLMPEGKSGSVWGLVPKMIRMPWNHEDESPVFLDVRRWVPVGDIVDMEMGAGALPPWATPGGPLTSIIEAFMLNKSMFTEKEIVADTDSGTEAAEKRMDYLFKSMMPNVPLPNPINLQIGGASINPFNLDQGSFQSFGWSGIEKSVNRTENAIGEVRTTPAAIASSVGIKLSAFPRDNMEAAIALDYKRKATEIEAHIKKLGRDHAKLANPTKEQDAALERNIEHQQIKLQNAQEEMQEKLD